MNHYLFFHSKFKSDFTVLQLTEYLYQIAKDINIDNIWKDKILLDIVEGIIFEIQERHLLAKWVRMDPLHGVPFNITTIDPKVSSIFLNAIQIVLVDPPNGYKILWGKKAVKNNG